MDKLVKALQDNSYEDKIHGIDYLVKPIPDAMKESVLDPRVYAEIKNMSSEIEHEVPEDTDDMVVWFRNEPAYPNKDVSTIPISKENRKIKTRNGDINIYIYQPDGGAEIKPAMLFFHGGAFIGGATSVVENFCKLIAEKADVKVIGVDYSLAPENKYPIGLNDCYDAFEWVYANAGELKIDKKRISFGGDSAGGTLSLGCSIIERDRVLNGELDKSRVAFEALIYPAVIVNNVRTDDFRWRLSDYEIPDTDMYAIGAATELKATSEAMARWYMGVDEKITDPLAAPLFQESLKGLPKTFMAVCEFDYLRLSSEAFARKMYRDEVDSKVVLYKGMNHSFIDKIGDCPQAYDLAIEIAKEIRSL